MADRAGGGSRLLVPKGPRADRPAEVVIEELRRQMFLMPLPPNPGGARSYPTHTILGRLMRLRGVTVNEAAKVPGGPSAKQLGDALADRKALSREHKDALATAWGIDRRLLD